MAVKLTYFPLWAKGASVALALEHSGMEWEGSFPQEWATLKPETPWCELPILEIPGVGVIGHEHAILNYIGSKSPEMGGATPAEFVASQQLMCESDDIYQKLNRIKLNMIPDEEKMAFWAGTTDATGHNRTFCLKVYLDLLQKFLATCAAGDGKFTSSGKSVGECKLFMLLHALKMAKDDCLAGHPELVKFYDRFAADPATHTILTTGGKMGGTFNQYFKVQY